MGKISRLFLAKNLWGYCECLNQLYDEDDDEDHFHFHHHLHFQLYTKYKISINFKAAWFGCNPRQENVAQSEEPIDVFK